MRTRHFGVRREVFAAPLLVALTILAIFGRATVAAEPEYTLPPSAWKPLFNGRDLSNWDKYLADPNAKSLIPNRDPKNVFTITNLNGEPVIHVSGEIYG